jgi:uncharacterized protein (DUF2336 family)
VDEKLREEDVARLLSHPNGETRADIAEKIATQHPQLSERERRLAEDIFRTLVKDAEVRVREALSRHLKDNPLVPHDVALALAQDTETVALPMLRFSEVLSDTDLIGIVRASGTDKQQAVAARAKVSSSVADALAATHDGRVVATLVSNEGADLSEATLTRVVEEFAGDDAVGRPLSDRHALPVSVAERLLARVSDVLRSHLLERTDLSPDVVSALLVQAREMAVLGLTEAEPDVLRLVEHLDAVGRLTPSIILRAMSMGDLLFFEAALARLARIPLENARVLIEDAGRRGFEALFSQAALPKVFYQAMRAAVDVSHDMQLDGSPHDRERFSRRMIERILTQYGDLGVEFATDDLEYLLAKLNQLPSALPQLPSALPQLPSALPQLPSALPID